ncbi:ABC transporter ATP-binding protein [uncultured Desulfobacter sp.]|uniref:ABC transporter ATP-binding protein n=1 Tax=uncultured Desulfobacter sp. TaxID=240139 RepID=UPI002AAB2882|nr:ABC transporter ATP-binding protein [uncultured Desulfobacter sp.]
MLKIRNVQTHYGNIQALKNISMDVEKGEIITLIGANGAGKSTTLMTMCGVVPATSGTIEFEGRDITGMPADQIAALGISQVPEGRRIFPYLTVMENLDMGTFLRNDKNQIKQDLKNVFELFPILSDRRNQQGGTLSGGEQQMLAISRAIMSKPKLLLLDEPSLGLAPIITKQIFNIIKKINQEYKTTIFLVEQNANLALKIADRGYVMETGTITMTGTGEKLLANEAVKQAYLGM